MDIQKRMMNEIIENQKQTIKPIYIQREFYVGPGMPPPKLKEHWFKRFLKYISL